ncbi:NADPH-dependent FMN reductase [Streptomyces cacaoi]|uniref:Putative reductase n=1 Tax=Streptomyces cacaoi TaxID=1898 RepID=A0A4Y3QW68_STRCI|nr:NAD(P)H-dependent oxidoreductase [Streptomyces cacaoi]NNG87669.1 NAD(P)H-dependent oxidoreductase [Streptomyces cacaoi]GEB48668.1 putative reductase [Streptomyces cacaoi]
MSTTAPTPLRLGLIVGSTREGRFAPVVRRWTEQRAAVHPEFTVDVLDLAELDLPAALPGHGSPARDALGALSERLHAADAFVVITPEYNHSYPAGLKQAIDLFHSEWQAKPVGFVSYGGMSGGLRAVEHLRPVFAELHAVTVRDCVSFHMPWDRFAEDGTHQDQAETEAAAKVMLDQLAWWGATLRAGKAARPYAA